MTTKRAKNRAYIVEKNWATMFRILVGQFRQGKSHDIFLAVKLR